MDHDQIVSNKVIGAAIEVHRALGAGLFENTVVVEIKSVLRMEHVFTAQLLTYLRITGLHVGLILNFNQTVLKDGIKRQRSWTA